MRIKILGLLLVVMVMIALAGISGITAAQGGTELHYGNTVNPNAVESDYRFDGNPGDQITIEVTPNTQGCKATITLLYAFGGVIKTASQPSTATSVSLSYTLMSDTSYKIHVKLDGTSCAGFSLHLTAVLGPATSTPAPSLTPSQIPTQIPPTLPPYLPTSTPTPLP